MVRSSRRAYIIGIAIGQTNVFFFDADGKQIAGFDIAGDARPQRHPRRDHAELIPDADITVEGIGDGIILAGTAASQVEAQQAYRHRSAACRRTVNRDTVRLRDSKVVNAIVVRGRDEVMLKVTVAEVERDVIKQLGINLSGSLGYGTAVVNFNNTNPFSGLWASRSAARHHRRMCKTSAPRCRRWNKPAWSARWPSRA